ncbi:MAG: 23S rRNA (guanosine(2251)-2'-O)-methyltransferase RlmB [Nitrospinae bacterium]|nr:23S rRNA (guanosine(2251)-2'-O)-methyltransferase RlmB [Nitrospinota bacterium]
MTEKTENFVYGINPVHTALKASKRKCYKIVVEEEKDHPRVRSVVDLARRMGVKIEALPRQAFGQKFRSLPHQGIVGYFAVKETLELPELIEQAYRSDPQPTLVLLDEIQDPHNLGAIIRSAEVLGIQGVIIPKHRSVPLNETVAKCSAGAVETVPIAWTTNLAQAAETLKKSRFWIVGVDMHGATSCHRFDFNMPVALVIGGEQKGIRQGLKKICDFTVSIPMAGTLGSLNASAAGAVVFYEILRQKRERGQMRSETGAGTPEK